MKHPLFIVALVHVAGLVVGRVLVLPAWLALAAIGLVAVGGGVLLLRHRRKKGPKPSGALLFAGVLLIGLFQQNEIQRVDRRAAARVEAVKRHGYQTIVGRLAADPGVRENVTLLVVKDVVARTQDGDVPLIGRVQVVCKKEAAEQLREHPPACGDIVEAGGRIDAPRALVNPGVFDYRAYLRQQNIHASVTVSRPDRLDCHPPFGGRNPWGRFRGALYDFRKQSEAGFARSLSKRNSALLSALCFGRGHRLEYKLRDAFAKCGMMHVFAVSGLHVGIVALILFTIFRVVGLNRRAAAAAMVAGLLMYMLLVGSRPSVVRATVMATALTLSLFMPTRVSPLGALSLALFVNLLFAPRSLTQLGFLLSYLAVFGIINLFPILYQVFQRRIPDRPSFSRRLRLWCNRYVISVLCVTFAVIFATMPIVAHNFHRAPLVGMLANLFVLPLVFFALASGFTLIVALYFAPALAPAIGAAADFICSTLAWSVEYWAELPFASVWQPAWPWFAILGYYALLIIPPTIRQTRGPLDLPKRRAWLLIQAAGIAAFLVLVPLFHNFKWQAAAPTAEPTGKLAVTFLDVGQGDCTVLEFPNGKTLVIDAGTKQAGAMVLIPYLEDRGIDAVDLAIGTHDDADHTDGLLPLLQDFEVDRLLLPNDADISMTWRALHREIRRGVTRLSLVTGQVEVRGFEPARIDIFGPSRAACANPATPDNELSLVVRVRFGEVDLLLTGDLSGAGEQLLVDRGVELDIELLKVGHHGSASSTCDALLEATTPEVAVISCGARNRYGHPAPAALERLERAGAEIYRTDRDGAVTFEIDGQRVIITTEQRKRAAE